MAIFDWIFEIGAVQRNANLVDLEKMQQNEYLLAKIGVDTAENEPLQIWGVIQFNIHFGP